MPPLSEFSLVYSYYPCVWPNQCNLLLAHIKIGYHQSMLKPSCNVLILSSLSLPTLGNLTIYAPESFSIYYIIILVYVRWV